MGNVSTNNWTGQIRRAIIAEFLRRDGFVLRSVVADMLEMSKHQITADIQSMLETAPSLLTYSLKQKRYNLNNQRMLEKFAPPPWVTINLLANNPKL